MQLKNNSFFACQSISKWQKPEQQLVNVPIGSINSYKSLMLQAQHK
jgi:hypothetical protein